MKQSFKVICIDGKPRPKEYTEIFEPITEGKTYTVIGEQTGHYVDGSAVECYELKGKPTWLYEKDRFIPLSKKIETKLINNKELVK